MRAALLAIMVFVLVGGYRLGLADEFHIPMNSDAIKNKTLMWFPKSIQESSEFKASDTGIVIEQHASDSGASGGSIGCKVKIPTSGDFQFDVDLDGLEVQAPQSGWGQGFIMKVKMADRWQSVLSFGVAARPNRKPEWMVTYEAVPNTNAIYAWIPMAESFRSGKLCIRREKDKGVFSWKPSQTTSGPSEIIVKEFPVPIADVATFEIVCTRQKEGNTRTRVGLKEVYLKGEAHDGLQAPPSGLSFVMLYLVPPLMIVSVAVLAIVLIKRKSSKGIVALNDVE
jgi:hypothetical protein